MNHDQTKVEEEMGLSRSRGAKVSQALESFSEIASVAVIVVGWLALAGWMFDIAILKSVVPGWATMKANTALAFVLAGCSLRLWVTGQPLPQRFGQVCGLFVGSIALLTLTEYAMGWDLGIDELLFEDTLTAEPLIPGRMAPAAAVSCLLFGVALFFLDFETRRGDRPAEWLSVAAGLISFVAMLGYAYDIQPLYRIGGGPSMALHTTSMFLVLGLGILCTRPDRGLMALVSSNTVGGLMLRRLPIPGMAAVIAFGWLQLAGQRLGFYDREVGLALALVAAVMTLVILSWLSSRSLNRRERSIRAGEARKEAILDAAQVCIISMDHEGKIVEFNRAAEKTFGHSRESAIGRGLADLIIPPRLRGRHRAGLSHYLKTGVGPVLGNRIEMKAMRSDRSEFPCELFITVSNAQSPPVFTGFIRDVTAEKAQEETHRKKEELIQQYRRALENNRLKGGALADLSYELRTPLTGIIGFAELMHDGKVGPVADNHKEYLGDILTCARHVMQLITDLVDFSKVEAGDMEFSPEPVDIETVIAEVDEIVRPLARKKQIRLTREVAPALARVMADARSLKQILYHYLTNAIKFTPESGAVTMRVMAHGADYFRIEVEDNGIGIRVEDLDRLFSEFQQLANGIGKKHSGTGLGLALTKRIVEAQSGRVGVTSTPGQGSTFYAFLPRVARETDEVVPVTTVTNAMSEL
jgi:PAS domain S-box-containing protein